MTNHKVGSCDKCKFQSESEKHKSLATFYGKMFNVNIAKRQHAIRSGLENDSGVTIVIYQDRKAIELNFKSFLQVPNGKHIYVNMLKKKNFTKKSWKKKETQSEKTKFPSDFTKLHCIMERFERRFKRTDKKLTERDGIVTKTKIDNFVMFRSDKIPGDRVYKKQQNVLPTPDIFSKKKFQDKLRVLQEDGTKVLLAVGSCDCGQVAKIFKEFDLNGTNHRGDAERYVDCSGDKAKTTTVGMVVANTDSGPALNPDHQELTTGGIVNTRLTSLPVVTGMECTMSTSGLPESKFSKPDLYFDLFKNDKKIYQGENDVKENSIGGDWIFKVGVDDVFSEGDRIDVWWYDEDWMGGDDLIAKSSFTEWFFKNVIFEGWVQQVFNRRSIGVQ